MSCFLPEEILLPDLIVGAIADGADGGTAQLLPPCLTTLKPKTRSISVELFRDYHRHNHHHHHHQTTYYHHEEQVVVDSSCCCCWERTKPAPAPPLFPILDTCCSSEQTDKSDDVQTTRILPLLTRRRLDAFVLLGGSRKKEKSASSCLSPSPYDSNVVLHGFTTPSPPQNTTAEHKYKEQDLSLVAVVVAGPNLWIPPMA